jgi:ABC-type nitrate/sulfonate/bicarbonate transport system substrate-binding protein
MMRQRLLLLIAALCSFWLPCQQAHAQELRRILYGTTASPSQLPVWVAKDAGYFEKQGLNVEPVQIRGGSLITVAILTGNCTGSTLRPCFSKYPASFATQTGNCEGDAVVP